MEAVSTGTAAGVVLVVDDERPLVELVAAYLRREGFRVLTAFDGPAAVAEARREPVDVLVLDVMLPGMDGLEVVRQIRQFSSAYILLLTARTDELDRVIGLTVGADDYMTKPFSPRELVARVRALLRRPRVLAGAAGEVEKPPLRFDGLTIDRAAHLVTRDGARITLTPLEFDLLATLAGRPGVVFTREQLIEQVWGDVFYGDAHVVDVHLSNLRKKLEPEPARPRWIQTVRGVGYRFHGTG